MNWKDDLVKYKREKAADSLSDAKLLYENKRFFSAVNRIYYSLFYEVSALLLREGLTFKKHSGVLGVFHKNFVKTNKVSMDMGKFYTRMFEFRHKGDYGDFIVFEEDKVEEWIDKAGLFIAEIERFFKTNNSESEVI